MSKKNNNPSVLYHRAFAMTSLAAAMMALASGAQAADFNITTTTDWESGDFANTNINTPPNTGNGHVRLDDAILTPFNHIWVALSGRGTAVRIDTNFVDSNGRVTLAESAAGAGAVLGEYYTAPNGRFRNPSRTTVDQNGDVWVGNRDESTGGLGSVAKISANPAGTTSSGIWNDNSNNGAVSTFNALPWTNTGNADNNGGTTTATDSANLLYVRTAGTNVRTIAVNANNDVWIGGYGNKLHQLYDGSTGAPNSAVINLGSNSGYGGLIDGNGILWSAGWGNASLSRYNPATGIESDHTVGAGSYGLAVDNNGNIWNTHLSNRVSKLDPSGNLIATYTYTGGSSNRGVTVTPADNHVWIANSGSNTVSRLNNDGVLQATIIVESGPMGMSVDSNGKVWATNYNSNSVSRINPATNTVDLTVELGPGASPYNYSDMTGTTVTGTTNPTGTWRKVLDGGANAIWGQIFWNTEPEASIPQGANILVEARFSDDQTNWTTYQSYGSGAFLNQTARYMEVRATLSGGVNTIPVLSDLKVSYTPEDGPQVCDVDSDGDIDKNDLSLISRARNQQATGPDDPRDSDRDGRITPNDVKVCIPQCTRANCAIQ